MQRILKIVNEERGIAQLTTDDERWYIREVEDVNEEKQHIYLPSATWIASYYPKGIAYMKWLANKGWDEAEAIKEDRGKYGSKVHKAVELILNGEELRFDEQVPNPYDEKEPFGQLTAEEYTAVYSFANWWNSIKEEKQVVSVEEMLWDEKEGFAGTMDLLLKIGKHYWLIDLKTSQYVWPSHEIQVSAYKRAVLNSYPHIRRLNLGILQVGYKRNKNGYKFNHIKYQYDVFKSVRKIWEKECANIKPLQRELPLSISLPDVVKNVSK